MDDTNIAPAVLAPDAAAARRPRLAAISVSVLVVLLAAIWTVSIPPGDPLVVLSTATGVVAALTLTFSGAILIARLPGNRIGWLLAVGGFLFAFANSGQGFGSLLLGAAPATASWVYWLSNLCWVPAIVSVAGFVPLVFPTGHLPSRRWQLLVAVAFASVGVSVVQAAFASYTPGSVPNGVTNPVALPESATGLLDLLGGLSSLTGIICLPLVAASLIARYRRAAGIERAQLRWLAAVFAIIGPAFAIGIALSQTAAPLANAIANLVFLTAYVGFALLPVAIGIAVLRYRLYDIDLIVRRTAVYVPLTGILAGLYAALIALLQRIFEAATGGPSDAAVILSTLILATAFTPIKNSLQGIVDRRFGDAGDAAHLLEQFVTDNANAPWALDPARTMRAFLAICIRAAGAPGGAAFTGGAELERRAGRIGVQVDGASALSIPVEAAGRRIGRIELAQRASGRPYSDRDLALLDRAAAALAVILEPPDGS